MSAETLLHATAVAVAVDPDGPLFGALLLGKSGAGKTAHALALVFGCPWRRSKLIADDAVFLSARDGRLWARGGPAIAGFAESRGFGPAPTPFTMTHALSAGFDLDEPVTRFEDARFLPLDSGRLLPIYPFLAGSEGGVRLRVAARAILARNGALRR
ncbi:MAG: hypothetical protein K2Q06_11785 [Parvularculaceae bacterium]|nr:hypothetical protein [Parvularculaceae bacterium]